MNKDKNNESTQPLFNLIKNEMLFKPIKHKLLFEPIWAKRQNGFKSGNAVASVTKEPASTQTDSSSVSETVNSSQSIGGNVNSNYAPVANGANNVSYLQQGQIQYAGYPQYPQQEQLPYAGYLQYVQIAPVMTMPNQMVYYQGNPFDSNIGTPSEKTIPATVNITPNPVENTNQNDNTQRSTVYYEDPINVALIKVDINQKTLNELKSKWQVDKSIDGCWIISYKADLKNKYKNQFKHQKIADFVVPEVKKDNKGYICSLIYKTASASTTKSKTVFISIKDAASGNICKRLKEEGIPCEQNINNILFSIFENKAVRIETPDKSGLDILGDRYFMTTQETLAENSFPPVTEKSFDMNRASDETPVHTIEHFCRCIRSFSDIRYVFTLILIRMMAIMTNVFANNGIRFRRLISTEINCYILCRIVQVYDRDSSMEALSIDGKRLKDELSKCHCEVAVFNDHLKDNKNATKHVESLYHSICDYDEKETADKTKKLRLQNDCIAVLASEFLGSLLSEEKVLCLRSNDAITQEDMSEFDRRNRAIDRLFINSIMTTEGIDELVSNVYKHYKADVAVRDTSYAGDYAVLMTVYFLLKKLSDGYGELPVPEAEMTEYLLEAFDISQKHRQLTGISDEFISCFNYLVEHEDIVLMKINDNKELADTENSKVICCKDDYIYIKNEVFDFIVSRMKQSENSNQVRKALKPYLKCDKSGEKGTYKYSVRVGDKHEKVTAVSTKVLSAEASLMMRESVDSVINTDDGIERILIGSNAQGQRYYWSYGHPDAGKSHLVLVGKTRMGKTCAINHIVRQLYDHGHSVVYLSFKNGNPESNLLKHGFDERFLADNFRFIQMKDIDNENFELPNDKITVFYCSKYSDMVERTAMMLYDYVSDGGGKEVFVVIDEAHMLSHSKDFAMYYMYNMGAGNGLHLITSYQTLTEVKPSEREIIQEDIVICFNLGSANDGTETAKRYNQKPYTQFGRNLFKLKKRECYLIGELENSNGDIDKPPAVKVTIPDVNL